MMVAVGALIACALVMLLGYFRDGNGTELWLPKSVSRYITRRAKTANDNVEAFSLGMLSAFAELPITIVTYFIVANCLVGVRMPLAAALLYIVIVATPMIALKVGIKTGRNAIAVQKWRIRNKGFVKLFASSGFAIMALFIVAFWVL